ncbi:MAG TPA: PQQ-binding-like beta-propeller repeat protein [Ktedonobacterales bacterium]
MSAPQTPTASRDSECAALAPLLALRGVGALDAAESARLDAHLATCAACQADAALDDALATQIRQALSAPAAAPLRLADILAAVAPAPGDRPQSVAPPSPKSAPRGVAGWWLGRRWAGGLSALAAAVAVIVLATYVFGAFRGALGSRRVVTPAPTLSPLLAQQTVYVPTGMGVYALRASDGALRWTYPGGIDQTPVTQGQAIFSLTLDHNTLYALAAPLGGDGASLLALNANSGALRWRVSIPNLWIDAYPQFSSLLLTNRLLIVAMRGPGLATAHDNGRVSAYSIAQGGLAWSRPLDEAPVSSPAASGGTVYIGTTGHVVALNAASGAQRWTSPIIPGARQEGAPPEGINTSVALTAAGKTVYVLAERLITPASAITSGAWSPNYYALSASDGSHLWLTSDFRSAWGQAATPAVDGGYSYIPFMGGLSAFALSNGMGWRFMPDDSQIGGETMTGAAVSGGVVYTTDLSGVRYSHDGVTTWENFTYAVRASDGVELWRAPTNGGLSALAPVVGSGVILAPSMGGVWTLRAGDGHALWRFLPPAGGPVGSPLFSA